jgi:hypothetical protein
MAADTEDDDNEDEGIDLTLDDEEVQKEDPTHENQWYGEGSGHGEPVTDLAANSSMARATVTSNMARDVDMIEDRGMSQGREIQGRSEPIIGQSGRGTNG